MPIEALTAVDIATLSRARKRVRYHRSLAREDAMRGRLASARNYADEAARLEALVLAGDARALADGETWPPKGGEAG